MNGEVSENLTSIQKQEVQRLINNIILYKSTMQGIFDEFELAMGRLGQENVFVGSASESLQERFNTLKQKFVNYTTTIDTFAANFREAKESEQIMEDKLAAETQNISDAS